MFEYIDWSVRGDYMYAKHGVTIEQANEATDDPDCVVLRPDYASTSGLSIRVIGYSPSYGDLLSVLLVEDGLDVWGINGWKSNTKDRRYYREAQEEG